MISETIIFTAMAGELSSALDGRLGPLLGRAHDAHRRLSVAALEPLELSPKGYGALAIVAADGPLKQQRLAQRQGVDRTTAVAVVDELERLGAVKRQRHATDRRAYALEVTPRGRRLLAAAEQAVAEAEERFLAPLTPGERQTLRAALRRLQGS